jgi:hypothetical protein
MNSYQTIWTRIGGTKFVAFMVLSIWAMWMIQTGVKPDAVLLDFVRYLFWGFVFGNVGMAGVQTFAATKSSASNGTAPDTTSTK